ncbi:hypothetical protein [Chryseobacterium sp. 5_R23647]|jgi:hypothetical protein|uniref:hypothetical protein n=1 Tax=Chryseobacterium sp. 5_R23647 TaxID=2258964 RepID=UPI000E21DB07|nr:hypothetical protein [Chryseobacterium sp. 5_R23647]REC44291.1 hypothetical protein DRF69_05035 [Chryseobacterium sp. 5_R23647]
MPKGFAANDNKEFTVVNVPNVKKMDLYKNVLNVINSIYNNPCSYFTTSTSIFNYKETFIATVNL